MYRRPTLRQVSAGILGASLFLLTPHLSLACSSADSVFPSEFSNQSSSFGPELFGGFWPKQVRTICSLIGNDNFREAWTGLRDDLARGAPRTSSIEDFRSELQGLLRSQAGSHGRGNDISGISGTPGGYRSGRNHRLYRDVVQGGGGEPGDDPNPLYEVYKDSVPADAGDISLQDWEHRLELFNEGWNLSEAGDPPRKTAEVHAEEYFADTLGEWLADNWGSTLSDAEISRISEEGEDQFRSRLKSLMQPVNNEAIAVANGEDPEEEDEEAEEEEDEESEDDEDGEQSELERCTQVIHNAYGNGPGSGVRTVEAKAQSLGGGCGGPPSSSPGQAVCDCIDVVLGESDGPSCDFEEVLDQVRAMNANLAQGSDQQSVATYVFNNACAEDVAGADRASDSVCDCAAQYAGLTQEIEGDDTLDEDQPVFTQSGSTVALGLITGELESLFSGENPISVEDCTKILSEGEDENGNNLQGLYETGATGNEGIEGSGFEGGLLDQEGQLSTFDPDIAQRICEGALKNIGGARDLEGMRGRESLDHRLLVRGEDVADQSQARAILDEAGIEIPSTDQFFEGDEIVTGQFYEISGTTTVIPSALANQLCKAVLGSEADCQLWDGQNGGFGYYLMQVNGHLDYANWQAGSLLWVPPVSCIAQALNADISAGGTEGGANQVVGASGDYAEGENPAETAGGGAGGNSSYGDTSVDCACTFNPGEQSDCPNCQGIAAEIEEASEAEEDEDESDDPESAAEAIGDAYIREGQEIVDAVCADDPAYRSATAPEPRISTGGGGGNTVQ